MRYAEAEALLYRLLPTFHKQGAIAYNRGLDKTLYLLEAMGNPHHRLRTVHIAGTNGKGSTSAFIASALTEAGYKTGLHTSPHLFSYTERFRINGKAIHEEELADIVSCFLPIIETIKPSFFEWSVAMALWWFDQQKVDVAVMETGMGGRYDSTNVITPLVSVITNIGMDHSQILGDTLTAIAGEKAGIIKPGIPVVVGRRNPETDVVFEQEALKNNALLTYADSRVLCSLSGDLVQLEDKVFNKIYHFKVSMTGQYQAENMATAYTALQILNRLLSLNTTDIVNGIINVEKNSGIMGRWQVLHQNPQVIADIAHNEDAIKISMNQLLSIRKSRIFIVIGMVSDKDIAGVMKHLIKDAIYIACEPDSERKMPADAFCELLTNQGLQAKVIANPREALASVLQEAHADDVIWIGGSNFVVSTLSGHSVFK